MANSDNIPPTSGSAASLLLIATAVGDPDGTRMVTSVVALLIVLGIGLVMLAVWLFKLTRPDDELLAPLEVMGERKWRRADPVWQRRRLDEVRPTDAQPLQPSAAPPDLDEAFDQGPTASGFDDLRDRPQPSATESAVAGTSDETESPAAEPAQDERDHETFVDDQESAADDDAATSGEPTPVDAEIVPEVAPDGDGRSHTPIGIDVPDGLPEREIDPALMAAAIAELDAELRSRPDRDAGS